MTAPRPWGELWAVLDATGPEPKLRVELRRAPPREVDVEELDGEYSSKEEARWDSRDCNRDVPWGSDAD